MSFNAADRPPMSGAAGGDLAVNQYDVYFSRQPMLDREGMLCGFELLPRVIDQRDDPEKPGRPGKALVSAFMARAVRGALTGHAAWLDVTRDFLFDDALLGLPPSRVMFELPPDIGSDPEVVSRLIQLHGRRYRFALDHVTEADESFAKLLPYVEAVKIDLNQIAPALLSKFASVLKAAGKILVAVGVESQADSDLAHELGFDRFQGYFFARPHKGARRASAPRQALLNLLQLLASEPTVAQLEGELKLNPVLVMHLMRLANSSSFGIGHKVTTLREAINATGTDRIARWTQLLLYADGRKVSLEDDPLLQLAATRARFMELAANQLSKARIAEQDAAFLAGVFSCVDAVFGGPLEATIDMLTLARPIRAAILNRDGVLGQLLSAAEALERADWTRLDEVCGQLAPLDAAAVAAIGLDAAEWAGMADRATEATGLERLDE
ncbi:EAL and HDOD domain-containing protein [Paraburkholderia dinghuensis]|uniref:EAL domain-containing protein n=1 Tax=Paraburkholderia dinghuensis TaxID=2305225 RepID=A0A3N6NFX0_9BURK|nr:EAL domain-containing protein [Paraburkholderia dinghuensis]RQH07557.1 EAL domain-containing protein [Paraburkholderia dinghuensis]